MSAEFTLAKARTQASNTSSTRIVVPQRAVSWVRPSEGEHFRIDSDATLPEIWFEVDAPAGQELEWRWRLNWAARVSGLRERPRGREIRTFSTRGNADTVEPRWLVSLDGKVLGGTLTVEVQVGQEMLARTVQISCVNPSKVEILEHLATLPDVDGFEKLIEKESRFQHALQTDGEPIVAFDGGYGLTQLTNPPPDFEDVWNWKRNVEVGAVLYQEKQRAARAYLGRSGRTYTAEQLRLETWCRWNGGAYHVWDAGTSQWVRNPNVLCAAGTGNIGWDTRSPTNAGLTIEQLDARDRGTFANPSSKRAENGWRYFGICYADSLNAD